MSFDSHLKVRIGDINYGQHLGHDRLIGLLHQARLEFLAHLAGEEAAGEKSFMGVALIMRRLEIHYLREVFLNEELRIAMRLEKVRSVSFSIRYEVWRADELVATATTEMVGFDYQRRRVQPLPKRFLEQAS